MRNVFFRKTLVLCLTASFIGMGLISSTDVLSREELFSTKLERSKDGGVEYWALLVAVGVYARHPNENRPSMLREIDNLYNALVSSPFWSPSHIKVIKGEDATVPSILQGLLWLNSRVDGNDISLVYITTHGFPLRFDDYPVDLPPRDENDGCDEALVTYWGFEKPLAIIWDDELNLFLSLLSSPGVCLIVDSCFSGGFNDPPYWGKLLLNAEYPPLGGWRETFSPSSWMEGFAEDVGGKGRVVLMSCREDEVSYGSDFTRYIAEGLEGAADVNMDSIVSAEEAFVYAKDRVGGWQHPTIYDGYAGELPLTQV